MVRFRMCMRPDLLPTADPEPPPPPTPPRPAPSVIRPELVPALASLMAAGEPQVQLRALSTTLLICKELVSKRIPQAARQFAQVGRATCAPLVGRIGQRPFPSPCSVPRRPNPSLRPMCVCGLALQFAPTLFASVHALWVQHSQAFVNLSWTQFSGSAAPAIAPELQTHARFALVTMRCLRRLVVHGLKQTAESVASAPVPSPCAAPPNPDRPEDTNVVPAPAISPSLGVPGCVPGTAASLRQHLYEVGRTHLPSAWTR